MDVWQWIVDQINTSWFANQAATAGAAAGTAAGTQGSVEDKAAAALKQAGAPPPVAPSAAIGQVAQSAVGAGPLAGNLRSFWVYLLLAAVALIGVWGLVSPGGGVAIIDRARR